MSVDTRLETKIQHQGFEKGEFVSEALRTCDETIALIEQFPWHEERYTTVDLTGPSIIIKDKKGRYLKFGHYYDPQFCLYYIDEKKRFYRKVIDTTAESHNIIKSFYDGDLLMDGFIRDKLRFGYMSHLKSKNFIYRLKLSRFYWFFFNLILYVPLSALFLLNPGITGIIFFLLFSSFLVLPNIILLINHYNNCKDLTLHISRGADTFMYGPPEDYKLFQKKDIRLLRYIDTPSRNPYSAFGIIELIFKDNTSIKFSSLLIGTFGLSGKLPGIPVEYIEKFFPYIKKS